MAYVKKKVNQTTFLLEDGLVLDGEIVNDLWLNYIQTQYDEWVAEQVEGEFGIFQNGYLNTFYVETPTRIDNKTWQLGVRPQGVAFVSNDGINIRRNGYRLSTDENKGEEFIIDLDDATITQADGFGIIDAGNVLDAITVAYIPTQFNHAPTHSQFGSDPITPGSIDVYTEQQVDDLLDGAGGIDETTMENITITEKQSATEALGIRTVAEGSAFLEELFLLP